MNTKNTLSLPQGGWTDEQVEAAVWVYESALGPPAHPPAPRQIAAMRSALTALTEARAAAGALQSSVDGWVRVPREPTEAMLKAAGKAYDFAAIHNYGGAPSADDVWEAMIGAVGP